MTVETKTLVTFDEEELDTINRARDILNQACDAIPNCAVCPLKEICADISMSPSDYLREVLIKFSNNT